MSNSDIKWSADGRTIPDIEPHTKTKHLLIEQYVTDLLESETGFLRQLWHPDRYFCRETRFLNSHALCPSNYD